MRHNLCLGVCIALIGCSSAPEKPDPTPLERITEVIELDDVESIGLGGGDQTGLSPASSDGAIAACLLYTSPSPRDATLSRMPSSA